MRQIALVLTLLPLCACSSFTWGNKPSTLTQEQRDRGLRDVHELASQYQVESFYRDVRRRSDGRNNAFGRDLVKILDFVDLHFWNYDSNDPAVNYPSQTTKLEHLGRFGLVTLSSVPGVDEITNR